jgi:hypothetical protein
MSQEIKELRVGPMDQAKRVMYLAKELLLNNDVVEIVSGTNCAPTAASAAQTLFRLNYVTYVDIRTETNVVNDSRRTKFAVTLKKTNQFKKLYDENEAVRKQKEEERQSKTGTTQDQGTNKTQNNK